MRADMAEKMRRAWATREQNGLGTRANGALQADVQRRISESVKARWEDGAYDDRVNGMLGKRAAQSPNWTWGRTHYREILTQYEPPVCHYCGEADEKLDVHHLDESHDNYLLTNLVWACVPCHMWRFHYQTKGSHVKTPFITIGKRFSFDYSHILPWHPGKCAQLHGHTGTLEVQISGRLDPNGVVMDFGDLSADVKTAVVDRLDHRFLNDFIPNPTSEALLIWIWRELESVGLKGIERLAFSETPTTWAVLTNSALREAYGWDVVEGRFEFVPKWETS